MAKNQSETAADENVLPPAEGLPGVGEVAAPAEGPKRRGRKPGVKAAPMVVIDPTKPFCAVIRQTKDRTITDIVQADTVDEATAKAGALAAELAVKHKTTVIVTGVQIAVKVPPKTTVEDLPLGF